MTTIAEVERELERELEKISGKLQELGVMPKGFRCSARLQGEVRDKKRNASFEKSWDPETDAIRIEFEPAEEHPAGSENIGAPPRADLTEEFLRSPLADLIHALHQAELRPGFSFVALKWFRDLDLPGQNFDWTDDPEQRQKVLREAIDRQIVLTKRVPNPKTPQFPVTAIRLNRTSPWVHEVLGDGPSAEGDFNPVVIRGSALSETVLRDRR